CNKEVQIIYGADKIHSYVLILRQILYLNRKPAYYLNRTFKLVCSELNDHFVSNDYMQMQTVIHPHAEPNHELENHIDPITIVHAQINKQKVDIHHLKLKSTPSFWKIEKLLPSLLQSQPPSSNNEVNTEGSVVTQSQMDSDSEEVESESVEVQHKKFQDLNWTFVYALSISLLK
ncbi:uncharacterized protein LOC111083056, partial [Limulus polyphemus]|uniref:Uncharacterized protein LOC111083056 n=1 Tax=Limulus polyphemus TaxID=6850 RepID=A0ABM1RUD1_LIMPO